MVHCQQIDPNATQHTDRPTCSFVWCYLAENNLLWTFSLRWDALIPMLGIANAYGNAVYQILNSESIKKQADADQKYLLDTFMDVEMLSRRGGGGRGPG